MNKNIIYFLFILTILFVLSCSSDKNKNELNNMLIKEDSATNDVKMNTKETDEINEYLIKPPSDSSYTGSVEEKYPNGIVKYKGFYRFGKRHGEWLYFFSNGNLWSECVYNRGQINGYNRVYYPNGKLYYSSFYKNGIKDSIWTYYDSTGKEMAQELYKNGQLIKRVRR